MATRRRDESPATDSTAAEAPAPPRARKPSRKDHRRLDKLLTRERALWEGGLQRVAGVDEAGVGPLAGPVVAAAVVFPVGVGIPGVNDSKQLTPERRAELAVEIRERAIAWSVARVEPEMIDQLNIYRASLEAMRLALLALAEPPDYVLVDARTIPGVDLRQEPIVGGDASCHAIAAASILAKTARDAIMTEYEGEYPGYGFAGHKGYSTAAHRQAIRLLGPCPIHRRSFNYAEQLTFGDW